MKTQPDLIGTVVEVAGSTVFVQLDDETVSGLTFVDGRPYRIGQVGSFVRIPIGYTNVYGIVTRVGAQPSTSEGEEAPTVGGQRSISIELFGEGQRGRRFDRGVTQHPSIGDEAFLVLETDLELIYSSGEKDASVAIGKISSATGLPALIDLNKFVIRHSSIIGSTGSGKSTTVAALLRAMAGASSVKTPRILLFDLHGEYERCLGDKARVYRLRPTAQGHKRLVIPYWAMSLDELLPLTFGDVNDAARADIAERILGLKREALQQHPRQGLTDDAITVDTPLPFSLRRLWYELELDVNANHTEPPSGAQSRESIAYEIGADGQPLKGDMETVVAPRYKPTNRSGADKVFLSGNPLQLRRQILTLQRRLRDPHFRFLFDPAELSPSADGGTTQDLDWLLSEWFGGGEAISIFNLKGVPKSVLTEVIGSLFRLVFDAFLWSHELPAGSRQRPLWMVLEEAHLYLGKDSGPASESIRRVVKEGRKYGLGLTVITQRPSEIDPTILSQCGTTIALRLTNSADQGIVISSAPDNLSGLLKMLPSLRTGEAIVLGEAVPLPMRAVFDLPPEGFRPDSEDPVVVSTKEPPKGWSRVEVDADYTSILRAWRSQEIIAPTQANQEEEDGL